MSGSLLSDDRHVGGFRLSAGHTQTAGFSASRPLRRVTGTTASGLERTLREPTSGLANAADKTVVPGSGLARRKLPCGQALVGDGSWAGSWLAALENLGH